jgi:hypothetical protein
MMSLAKSYFQLFLPFFVVFCLNCLYSPQKPIHIIHYEFLSYRHIVTKALKTEGKIRKYNFKHETTQEGKNNFLTSHDQKASRVTTFSSFLFHIPFLFDFD